MNRLFDNSDVSASIKRQRIDYHNVRVKTEYQEKSDFVAHGAPSTASVQVLQPAVRVKREEEEERPIRAKKPPADEIINSVVPAKKEASAAPSDKLHVVFIGPVLGQFKTLAHFLKIWEDKIVLERNATLDACFCVGPFFHNDVSLEDQAKELLSGGYALPCPVYFVDEGSLPKVVTKEVLQSFDSAHVQNLNLHHLSASDGVGDLVSLLDNRLSVAFTSPKFSFHPESILERKCKDSEYKGCDILITSEWGKGINSILDITQYFQDRDDSDEGPDAFFGKLFAQESFDVARVALLVQPHHHITPSTAPLGYCYFQTSCFTTELSSFSPINHCCKGFHSLSCCGPSTEKRNNGKDTYSIVITPGNVTEAGGELRPKNNPYRTYAMYLENSSKVPVAKKSGTDLDHSQYADTAFDNDSISLVRQKETAKRCSNRETYKGALNSLSEYNPVSSNSCESTISSNHHLEHHCMAGWDETTLQDYIRSSNSSPTSTNESVKQKGSLGLITAIHYESTLYDEPVLHNLINNGKYEEAMSLVECRKTLRKKVDDESSRNSTYITILEVESFDSFGFLPIHSLLNYSNHAEHVRGKKRLNLFKKICDKFPQGLRTRSLCSFDLPLSLACQPCIHFSGKTYSLSIDGVDEKIIRGLTKGYPTAAKVIYEGARSVLHILLEHRPSLSLVKFIVDELEFADHASKDEGDIIHGSLLEYCDEESQLPIHTAIQYYAPFDVIKYLIQKFPDGVRKPMDKQFFPLHCAARWGCSEAVMTSLLDSFPEAVVEKNSDGLTPLELLFSHEEIWIPNFDVPDVAFDDKIRTLIISRQDESQIPPRYLMSPFKMLISMIEAYHTVQSEKKIKGNKAKSEILAILKSRPGTLWKNMGKLRERLRGSKQGSRELDQVEAYLRCMKEERDVPLQVKSE
jgi:hypothetical protein